MRNPTAFRAKAGLARTLTGGVIAETATPEQATLAEDVGAMAVLASGFEDLCVSVDDVKIRRIIESVSIPVVGDARDHAAANALAALKVDYILERRPSGRDGDAPGIDKWSFATPFASEAANLGEVARRLDEGATMICCTGPNVAIIAERLRRISPAGRLPVLLACAGVAAAGDAALLTRAGAEAVFVGSDIFGAEDPPSLVSAIVDVARRSAAGHV